VDIREVIDYGPFTRLQFRAVSLCFFLNVLDGVDVGSISFAGPVLSSQWGIDAKTFGVVASAALAGMMVGSMLMAPFGDAVGRRKLLTLSLTLIAIGMLGVIFAGSLSTLLALRFVTGLGLGGVVPTMATFAAELSPRRSRAFAVTAVSSGYSLGSALTGLAALWMVPHWGWQSLFTLGGILTVIALPLVLLFLPESLEFLLGKQPPRALERINSTLTALHQPELAALPPKAAADTRPRLEQVIAALLGLLAPRYLRATLLLWLAFPMSLLTLYFLQSWVPQLTANAGLPTSLAFLSGTILNLGLFVGNASVGWFGDRFGLRRSIATYLGAGAIVLLCFSYLQGTAPMLIGLGTVGVMQGGFLGLYAVGAKIYPAANRVTGIGWAAGFGRLGAVLGPWFAGYLVAFGFGMTGTFFLFALPLAIAALAVAAMRSPELGAPERLSAARTRASAARGT
jgi:benzoate transport